MKIVAAIFADFEQSFLGGRSQLRTEIGSRSVIEHTLTRLMQVTGLDGRCLFIRPRDKEAAVEIIARLGLADQIEIVAGDDGQRVRRQLLRCGRKWNLEGWRGSPLATTWFDEYVEPLCVARVLDHYQCEGVLCLDGHQPALDPAVASGMLAHQREHEAEAKLVFTQAPPGLAGIILRREVTRELLEQRLPVGILLNYRPEMAQGDPITRPVCFQIDAAVAQTPARLTADTRRSREQLTAAFAALGEDVDAGGVCAWLRQAGNDRAAPLPVEVELELTTDDPLPDTTLRPRGARVPARQLKNLEHVSRLAEQLAEYDDRLIFLSGHGDPLCHPALPDVLRRIRSAGVCGLGIETPLVNLSDEGFEALLEQQVDILAVRLDAHTAATYRTVHNADHFERVIANVERVQAARVERTSPQPLVVCSMTRSAATLHEMEAFFDHWIKTTGWVAINGYNDYCGVLPADALLAHTPPIREPCRRLDTGVMLLADGTVGLCGQDVAGSKPLGSWFSEPLPEIWSGARLREIRQAHGTLDLGELTLCQRCGEWSRP